MDEQGGGGKISGIRQIVKLKEIIHKWQNITLSKRSNDNLNQQQYEHVGISTSVSKRLKESISVCDSDEEGCHSPEPPPDVLKGFLAVYVGEEIPRRRFIIPTKYLSHHLFKVLLEKAEEEFGFDHDGGLTIPCEIETFKYLLNCIETENQIKGGLSDNEEGESSSSRD
ncbi:hypothetical protein RND81_07G074800 [Saponaria officinalis]|uniref:Uncharacterized protein n=1 Tax=Saponaria officinalis TaxID=3572 RepID=A0AAW1JKY9_SAPOF